MYGETHSESKRVNKLNTVLWSCCLKQLFYGIDCLLKLSQKARTAIKYCYHREKRKSNKSDIYQAAKSIYR